MIPLILGLSTLAVVALIAAYVWQKPRYSLEQWIGGYIATTAKRRERKVGEPVHVLLCIADHYEPRWGNPTPERAEARVDNWLQEYPKLFGSFRDADGRPPRHTFFFPLEEYVESHVEKLARLCHAGFGEVEVHLHHDNDNAEALRVKLLDFVELLANRHKQLARHKGSGRLQYGFIHGNWALDNARPDGRWCGVNNELDVLRETGCYADFTLPSAPSATQTSKINSIYYAVDDPHRPKSHDWGIDVGRGSRPEKGLLLVQGPLLLDWHNRKWGLIPRVENACIQRSQPPSMHRLDQWLRARVHVAKRPDWLFVKLHTHGGPESNQEVLLGPAMVRFHENLARRSREDSTFFYHYVTAREMYNLVRAAEDGFNGSVRDALDYELIWNGITPLA